MKSIILSTGLLLLLFTGACESPEQSADEEANPLQGTWKLVDLSNTHPDTTYDISNPPDSIITMLNATHFAILRRIGGTFTSQGGRYEYDGNTYRESYGYHTNPEVVGETYAYQTQLEGDTLWHKTGTIGDSLTIDETWRRIE